MIDPHILPPINASLNAIAAMFLLAGYKTIKEGKQREHRNYMIGALVCSSLFLVCYLYYHATVVGVTRYQGEGIARIVYFSILLTHTPLATLMVPFIIAAVWFAWKKDYVKHARITRKLLPVWLYVSLTGVLIYLMLYVF